MVFAVRLMSYALTAPAVEMLELVAFKLKEFGAPAPAELAFKVTVVPAVSVTETTPVELTVKLVAFVGFAADSEMPAVPAERSTVGELRSPVVVIPLAALVAFSVKAVPLLAPRLTTPAKVSLMLTVPAVALAVRLLALRVPPLAKSMLLEPAVRVAVPAFKLPVALIPPAPLEAFKVKVVPLLAPSETKPAKLSLILIVPPVELAARMLAFSEPPEAKSILPEPAASATVAALRTPLAVMPLAA